MWRLIHERATFDGWSWCVASGMSMVIAASRRLRAGLGDEFMRSTVADRTEASSSTTAMTGMAHLNAATIPSIPGGRAVDRSDQWKAG
jgi:hypothetical protein